MLWPPDPLGRSHLLDSWELWSHLQTPWLVVHPSKLCQVAVSPQGWSSPVPRLWTAASTVEAVLVISESPSGLFFPFLFSKHSPHSSFPGGTGGKELVRQCRRHKRCRFDPWSGRSPGGGHDNPLQYSCLENPMDRGAWRAVVHKVRKCWTQLKWLSACADNTLSQLKSCMVQSYRTKEFWKLFFLSTWLPDGSVSLV